MFKYEHNLWNKHYHKINTKQFVQSKIKKKNNFFLIIARYILFVKIKTCHLLILIIF